MKIGILVALIMFATTSSAGVVFEGMNGESLILGVDDCSATQILNKAITESGVNPLDSNPTSIGTCLNEADRTKCEGTAKDVQSYVRTSKGDIVKCFSNTSSKLPALCISNPRTVTIPKYYADAGKVNDIRARFDAIYVIRKDGSGYTHSASKSWTMDKNGCEPVDAFIGNPSDSQRECEALIRSYMNGGPLYPRLAADPKFAESRFADGKLSQDHINAIGRLHVCLESYPKLIYSSSFSEKNGQAEKDPQKKPDALR